MNFNQQEHSHISVGLIYRPGKQGNEYLIGQDFAGQNLLGQTDKKDWSPILCERLEKESFRDSIIREIAWSFDLDRNKDFIVSNMALASHEFIDDQLTTNRPMAIAFYRARLFTASARGKVDKATTCKWVTSKELCSGSFETEQTISPIVVNWINRWSVIRPWD